MEAARNTLLSEEKEAEECRLKEEGEDAFHCEGHADDAARTAREFAPVCTELELHGNPGDYTKKKIDSEDFPPEASGDIVLCLPVDIRGAESNGLQDDDQKRQPHSELWEEIVVRDGEAKVNPVQRESVQA